MRTPLSLKKFSNTTTLEIESYHAYWDRYMGLLDAWPKYVYGKWLVSFMEECKA